MSKHPTAEQTELLLTLQGLLNQRVSEAGFSVIASKPGLGSVYHLVKTDKEYYPYTIYSRHKLILQVFTHDEEEALEIFETLTCFGPMA